QRTHGHALYVNLTPPTSVRARALRPSLLHSAQPTHLRALASNTLKKRNVFLHILLLFERQRDRPINAKKTYPDGKSFSV
ncbi:MAG: hypothetical protein PHN20_10100, partial [Bacteroidales bacterium]|nr:hypothetical protein [Bacteroidales bacterium]